MIVRISSTSAIYDVQHRRRRREVLHLRILSVVEGDSESLWCYGKMRFCFFFTTKIHSMRFLIYVVICFWYVFSWLKCGIQTHRIKAGLGRWHHAGTAERTLAMPDWATTNGITRPGLCHSIAMEKWPFIAGYPLVNVLHNYGTITIFNGKTHYKITMFNSYASLPEGNSQ